MALTTSPGDNHRQSRRNFYRTLSGEMENGKIRDDGGADRAKQEKNTISVTTVTQLG